MLGSVKLWDLSPRIFLVILTDPSTDPVAWKIESEDLRTPFKVGNPSDFKTGDHILTI